MTNLLEVAGLTVGYDGSTVVRDLDLVVEEGQTAVIVGPNGHGKTTLVRAITGLTRARSGRVTFLGERIDALSAEQIARLGVVHVMQGDGLFGEMTVEENLMMGAFPSASWKLRRATLDRIYERFEIVHGKRAQKANTLSGGERRLVGLSRGLMRPARLLVIDEPSLGLAPVAIEAVYRAVDEIRRERGTVILIEENFSHIEQVADIVHVLETGSIVRSGPYDELARDRTVMETYLGVVTPIGGAG